MIIENYYHVFYWECSKIFISSSFSFDIIVDAPYNARNHNIDDLSVLIL